MRVMKFRKVRQLVVLTLLCTLFRLGDKAPRLDQELKASIQAITLYFLGVLLSTQKAVEICGSESGTFICFWLHTEKTLNIASHLAFFKICP